MPIPPAALAVAALAALLAAQPLSAEPTGPNLAPDAPARGSGALRTLTLAWDLYAEGLQREDPVLLLTAVRLAAGSAPRAATGWITDAAPLDAAEAPALPHDPASPEAAALATLMAEGDPALADLAEDVLSARPRGRLGDGQLPSVTARIAPGATDVYRIPFNGELPAEVALIGDGSGNLDLTVTDETGHRICAESGPSDRAYCGFVPLWNGWFDVAVTNPGPAAATYRLSTN